MAYVQKRELKTCVRWWVVWIDPTGQRRHKGFAGEQEARAFAESVPQRTRAQRAARSRVPLEVRIRRCSDPMPNGCWLWRGRITNAGYGQIGIREGGRQVTRSAHRISYETFIGPIPEGLVIDHLCRERRCVNPAHMEPVTQRENVMRSPIGPAALNARKTHCPQGHAYDEINTYWQSNGGRLCRTCQRERVA